MIKFNQTIANAHDLKTISKIAEYIQLYSYLINYCGKTQTYVAQCVELGITAHQASPAQALTELREAINIHLQGLEDNGDEIPIPFSLREFSGQIQLKMSPQKHQEVAIRAQAQGISLNHYINSRL